MPEIRWAKEKMPMPVRRAKGLYMCVCPTRVVTHGAKGVNACPLHPK